MADFTCTCAGWESANCTKLCECAPEYRAHLGELEYASWLPLPAAGCVVHGLAHPCEECAITPPDFDIEEACQPCLRNCIAERASDCTTHGVPGSGAISPSLDAPKAACPESAGEPT